MSDFYELEPAAQAQHLQALAVSALKHWNVSASAELNLIKHRENAVFSVIDKGASQRYVIRVHRAGYHSDRELLSELQWMRALENSGVLTPDVIPTIDGELFKSVRHINVPEPRQTDLVAWIHGKPLAVIEDDTSLDEHALIESYRILGETTARVHNQASTWELPTGFTRHAWDVDGLLGESPFWGRFWELQALNDAQRDRLQALRPILAERLSDFGKGADRYSMIHADLIAENILVSADGLRLIDFDDAGFGWHLFEIATSLFWFLDAPYYQQLEQALLGGYQSARSLHDEHIALLPSFLVARATTYLGWAHTRSETDTARELTSTIVAKVMALVDNYLD